jgi:hypothetical protein
VTEIVENETRTREKCVAFAMLHYKRIGVVSTMAGFGHGILRMVLECVFIKEGPFW